MPAAQNGLEMKLLGCVGAVKEISTQPGNQHFAAVGLDRLSTLKPVGYQQLSSGS